MYVDKILDTSLREGKGKETDYCCIIIANAHARLHTTAVRESAALHSGKELYTHSRVFPAGSTPRAFAHMLPSLRQKGPGYLIIYLFSAVYYALFIALCCDHRYRSHVHVRT